MLLRSMPWHCRREASTVRCVFVLCAAAGWHAVGGKQSVHMNLNQNPFLFSMKQCDYTCIQLQARYRSEHSHILQPPSASVQIDLDAMVSAALLLLLPTCCWLLQGACATRIPQQPAMRSSSDDISLGSIVRPSRSGYLGPLDRSSNAEQLYYAWFEQQERGGEDEGDGPIILWLQVRQDAIMSLQVGLLSRNMRHSLQSTGWTRLC
jgi:hypothetical protein